MPKLSWTLSARATELDPHRDLSPYGLRARASVQVPGTGGADSAPIGKCATMWFFRDRRRAPSSYEVMRPSASGIAPRDRSKAGQAEAVSSGQGQRDVPDILQGSCPVLNILDVQGNNMPTRPKPADRGEERCPRAPLPLCVLLRATTAHEPAVHKAAHFTHQAANAVGTHGERRLAREVLHARPHRHAAAGNAHLLQVEALALGRKLGMPQHDIGIHAREHAARALLHDGVLPAIVHNTAVDVVEAAHVVRLEAPGRSQR